LDDATLKRFWSKVDKSGDCWLWTDSLVTQGYGRLILPSGRSQYAHRLAYAHYVGAVTASVVIAHLCGRRACVRPEHLRDVGAYSPPRTKTTRRTACRRGHVYTRRNTVSRPNGKRQCRTCLYEANRRWRSAIKEKDGSAGGD